HVAAPSLDSAEGGEATVLVQDFHLSEADLAQQVDLVKHGTRRVLLLDVGEHMLSILRPAQLLEACSISVPHHGLRLSGSMRHESRDPYGRSPSQRMVALSKDARPLAVLTQVVEHGCRNDDVELRGADVEVTDVGLRCLDLARCHWAHPLDSAVEHRRAQVNERDVEIRQAL